MAEGEVRNPAKIWGLEFGVWEDPKSETNSKWARGEFERISLAGFLCALCVLRGFSVPGRWVLGAVWRGYLDSRGRIPSATRWTLRSVIPTFRM